MTVCPIAIVSSCRKCPVFSICPLKGVIGDYVKESAAATKPTDTAAKRGTKRR